MNMDFDAELDYMNHITEYTDVEVCRRLTRDMGKHIWDPRVQETGLVDLWVLGINERNRSKLLDYGADKAIAMALLTHPRDEQVLESGCAAIKNLSGNLFSFFYKHNMGQLVVNSMRSFPNNSKLLEQGCLALRTLATSRAVAEDLVESVNCQQVIKDCMMRHVFDERVQKAACGAIWSLSLNDLNRDRLFICELPSLVIKAMKLHPKAAKVQEYGCAALWSIGGYNYSLCHMGAADAVINAMDLHETVERIIEYGCGALRNFASLQVNAKILMYLKADEVLVKCMRQQMKKSRVQECACLAIWSLGLWDENKHQLMQNGIGHVVAQIIKVHVNNSRVVETAVGVLTNLSTMENNALELLNINIDGKFLGDWVITAASKHPTDESVQTKVLCALRNFFWWTANSKNDNTSIATNIHSQNKIQQQLISSGAIQCIQAAMKFFPTNELIQRKGIEILSKIQV